MTEMERPWGRAMVAGVRTVAVVGCGRLARAIAECCARAEFPTTAVSLTPGGADRLAAQVHTRLETALRRGELDLDGYERADALLWFAGDLAAVEGVDLVIECAAEGIAAKRSILAGVEAVISPAAIVAADARGPALESLSWQLARPERFLGLRFYDRERMGARPGVSRHPGPLGRECDVEAGPSTDPAIVARAARFIEALGATAAIVAPADTMGAPRGVPRFVPAPRGAQRAA